MAKIKIKSGDVFQVPLPDDLGFAYAKCINLLEINPEARYPTLIRVYNYRSLVPQKSIGKFVDSELILCQLLIAGILPAVSGGIWKLIGNVPVQGDETVIPHYKKPEPNEEHAKEWYYLINADISQKVKSTYENVRHLETIAAIGSELVGTKIAMALLKDEGKEIEDYFKLDQYYEKEFYRPVIAISAYYKLPDHMKGRAL